MGKVYSDSSINSIIQKYKIKEALIAIPSVTKKEKDKILDKLNKFPIKVSSLPSISQIAEGKIKIDDIEQIKIEDILGRDQVSPNKKLMEKNIKKKILVSGAGGSIGSELCRKIIKYSQRN